MIWDDVPFIFDHLQDTLQIALLFGRANVVMRRLNPLSAPSLTTDRLEIISMPLLKVSLSFHKSADSSKKLVSMPAILNKDEFFQKRRDSIQAEKL